MTRQSYMCLPATPSFPYTPVCVCVCGRKSLLIANRVEKWIFHRISILWLKFIHEALIRKSSTDVRSRFRHPPSLTHTFPTFFVVVGRHQPLPRPLFHFSVFPDPHHSHVLSYVQFLGLLWVESTYFATLTGCLLGVGGNALEKITFFLWTFIINHAVKYYSFIY